MNVKTPCCVNQISVVLFSHCLLTLFAKKNSSRKLKNTFVNNYCSVVGYTHNQIRQDSFKKQPIIVDALNEIHFLIVNNNTTVYIYIFVSVFVECNPIPHYAIQVRRIASWF